MCIQIALINIATRDAIAIVTIVTHTREAAFIVDTSGIGITIVETE